MKPHPVSDKARTSPAVEDDQLLAERDQALADVDQKGSDSDQAEAGREQAAAESDQAASDQDLLHGGDPDVHSTSRNMRNRSAQQRRYSAQRRAATADARDQVAHDRDLTAAARDRVAQRRDRQLATHDAAEGQSAARTESRRSAAAERVLAAAGREQAAADREQSAHDREQAASDRLQAQADREALLVQLAVAKTDGLTGTRSRAVGLEDFNNEIDRARRSMAPLVIAYVDVVGLKAVNDAYGHAAGDALLQRAVSAIRDHLRSYDLIVRIGGDEFLTVMSGATMEQARLRFDAIQAALESGREPCRIKVGFAALAAEDSADELIRRADAQLPASRRP